MSELLEKILSKDNMNTAYKRVCANKGAGGVDGVSVEELGDHIKENWESIRNQIRSRKYKPQPVRRVEIPKPNGGMRKLGIPMLWSSIFVTLMANKIGGLQFGIYRNCQISSRVFHTAVAALPLTKANRSDFE